MLEHMLKNVLNYEYFSKMARGLKIRNYGCMYSKERNIFENVFTVNYCPGV